MNRILMGCLLLAYWSIGFTASSEDPAKVKAALLQVQNQIKKVEKNIYHSQRQEKALTQQLAGLEKEIGEKEEQLRHLNDKLNDHQKSLQQLKTQEAQLQKTKKKQEEALAQLVQATFAHQHKEKLRILLEQKEWSTLARTNQYYHFFCQARAKQLATLQENLQKINQLQQEIQQAHLAVQTLSQKMSAQQAALKTTKEKRKALLSQLTRQITTAAEELTQLQRQEQHLEQFFKALDKKLATTPAYIEPAQDFVKMKRKLAFPLALANAQLSGLPGKTAAGKKTYIAAPAGTPVSAVFGGRVVFAEWLRGIGLLIILDHGHGYMTLYGNNQKLYKSLGDWVNQGEMIARVGQSGGHAEPGLYFEIRKNGEALDPTAWLQPKTQA